MLIVGATLAMTSFAAPKKDATTMYWVAVEPKKNDPNEKLVWLRTCDRKNIKQVTHKFAKKIQMEGTGILNDGKTLNVDCRKQCNYNEEFDCFK